MLSPSDSATSSPHVTRDRERRRYEQTAAITRAQGKPASFFLTSQSRVASELSGSGHMTRGQRLPRTVLINRKAVSPRKLERWSLYLRTSVFLHNYLLYPATERGYVRGESSCCILRRGGAIGWEGERP